MYKIGAQALSSRIPLTLGLVVIFSSFAPAHASDQFNGPFGPQMHCYRAIQKFSSIDPLSPSEKVQGMTPVLMEVSLDRTMLALQQSSAPSTLHVFNSSGEFDAPIPLLPTAGDRACVDGVSFPDGKRAVVYNSYGTGYSATESSNSNEIYATIVASNPGETCSSLGYKKNRTAIAHQVGVAGQPISQSLLNAELAKMIESVHAKWKVNAAAAKRRKEEPIFRKPVPASAFDPKTGILSVRANKAALQACGSALTGSEFQSLRTVVTQEEKKFDQPQPVGGNNGSGGISSHAASVY